MQEKNKSLSEEARRKISEAHKGKSTSRKGKILVSKIGEYKYIPDTELDYWLSKGYIKGNINDKQKEQNKRWYNNGEENILIKNGEEPPEGFTPGMYQKRPGGFSKFNYRWYTNGIDAKRIKEGDTIPTGWYIGLSESHKLKDKESQQKLGNYHLLNKE